MQALKSLFLNFYLFYFLNIYFLQIKDNTMSYICLLGKGETMLFMADISGKA